MVAIPGTQLQTEQVADRLCWKFQGHSSLAVLVSSSLLQTCVWQAAGAELKATRMTRGFDALPRQDGQVSIAQTVVFGPFCKSCLELLWQLLDNPDVGAVHLAPPCGASSQARSIPAGPKAPQPLKSAVHPDGLPSLQGLDAKRVHSANVLYSLTGDIVLFAFQKGILVSVENPASSWFWMCSGMQKVGHLPLLDTFFHHCMFGSERKKHTKFLHTVPHLTLLGHKCDGQHARRPWGKLPNGKWATAMECAYPPKLCADMAQGMLSQLVSPALLAWQWITCHWQEQPR